VILASCDTLVQEISPDKIPNTSPKLVVGCFISPKDKFIRARLLTTIPLFGQDNLIATNGVGTMLVKDKDTTYLPSQDDIIDASIEISEGGKKIALLYDKNEGIYSASTANFPIEVGKTYALKATAKDGRVITATCTVPKAVAIESLKIDSVSASAEYNINGKSEVLSGFNQLVAVTWKDFPKEKNYYEITGFTELLQKSNAKDSLSYRQIYFNNQGGRGIFFEDKNVDGQAITAVKGLYKSINWFLPTNALKTPFVKPVFQRATLQLSHVDENYLLYRRSIYDARQQNFFTEPTLVYTNIKGGYGCFGAYNTTNLLFSGK
jgi:Domain of unknown function (DUF4249)